MITLDCEHGSLRPPIRHTQGAVIRAEWLPYLAWLPLALCLHKIRSWYFKWYRILFFFFRKIKGVGLGNIAHVSLNHTKPQYKNCVW